MESEIERKLGHLAWALASRSGNQASSLRLLRLFYGYETDWKTQKLARAAQDLTAVAFSLWRAAFLADKTGRRIEVFNDGRKFLEKLIEDNAIAYVQDKASQEWTFNYYTRNARSSLEMLHKYWLDVVPKYEGKKRNARERWDYCHQLLDEAIAGFERHLTDKQAQAAGARQAREIREARKERRAKSREVTLLKRTEVAAGPTPKLRRPTPKSGGK